MVDLDQFVTKDIIQINEKEAVLPLTREFPNFCNKEDLALPSELEALHSRPPLCPRGKNKDRWNSTWTDW